MDLSHSQNSEESSVEVTEPRRIRDITPLRGHTMKEYDEKISQLRKENFKLKLRIYFLEEGSSGKGAFNGKDNSEALIKYEELKNEAELTRNELNEKQGLLFDAMLALDAMEEKLGEEKRQRHAEVVLLEERIMQLEKELKSSRCPRSPGSFSDYDYNSNAPIAEALSPRSPRAFVAVATHVRDLQEQVCILELAIRDETANSNRLKEQLKMEREIRNCQDEEITLRFQSSEEQTATILQLTVDLQRYRERCSDLQDALAQKEKLRLQLEHALQDREARVAALEEELNRLRAAEESETRSLRLALQNGRQSMDTKTRQWNDTEPNDAVAELSRLRIDYNLALQNMARFLRRSRMQQAALERAERREQQLSDEIRELRDACSAAKTDLGSIKDQLSPVVRANRLSSVSPPGTPEPDSGDYAQMLQGSRTAMVRSAPSLLSWILQSLSQSPEEARCQDVQSEEEHLRQMQLIGILSLLSRMATIVNNMLDIDSEERQTLQNLTEAAILLCSSSSDSHLKSKKDLKIESAILLNHTVLPREGGGDDVLSFGRTDNVGNKKIDSRDIFQSGDQSVYKEQTREVESQGNRNMFCTNGSTSPGTGLGELTFRLENLSEVAKVGSDVTLRMKVQVVSQSETLENGISSATLIPCVTHKGKARPVMKGDDASSFMLLQDAWFQLEEARLLCERLETPPPIPDAKSTQAMQETTPPKTVCDIATQTVSQPHLLDFDPSGTENPLKRENMELRSQLRRSKTVLQQTYSQLAAANERKRQVEDVICDRRGLLI